jgi:hypothetical protein
LHWASLAAKPYVTIEAIKLYILPVEGIQKIHDLWAYCLPSRFVETWPETIQAGSTAVVHLLDCC